jgi:hypothetical protein
MSEAGATLTSQCNPRRAVLGFVSIENDHLALTGGQEFSAALLILQITTKLKLVK